MSLLEVFHSVATGSRRKRELLTPVGLLFFGLTLAAVVVLGLYTDRLLRMPEVLPGRLGESVGVVLLVLGSMLCGWCVLRFRKAKGTPVPFNPPTELVVAGPYVWMRNPMVTGVFTVLFGIGLILHSASIVFIWTPLYILAHVIELKKVRLALAAVEIGESVAHAPVHSGSVLFVHNPHILPAQSGSRDHPGAEPHRGC